MAAKQYTLKTDGFELTDFEHPRRMREEVALQEGDCVTACNVVAPLCAEECPRACAENCTPCACESACATCQCQGCEGQVTVQIANRNDVMDGLALTTYYNLLTGGDTSVRNSKVAWMFLAGVLGGGED